MGITVSGSSFFLMPLDLHHEGLVCSIERLLEGFGHLFYKKFTLRQVYAYFSYFVLNVVGRVIHFQVYLHRCDAFKKTPDLGQFTLNMLNKTFVRIEMYGLDVHVHDLVYW